MGAAEVWKFAPAYELPSWPFVAPPDLAARERRRYPVVIAGGGLAGLTLACDLALRGVAVVVLDEDDTVGVRGASSRGICYAQKSLEIFDRLGIYEQDPRQGHHLVGRSNVLGRRRDLLVQPRRTRASRSSRRSSTCSSSTSSGSWSSGSASSRPRRSAGRARSSRVEHGDDGALVEVETPAGNYALEAEWFVDATGANSRIRDELGLEAHPSRHTDRWCISDVRFKKPFAVERWTWIDAPFNEGRAVWQHLMADAVWRLDYQMDEHADPESISRPEVAGARLREQLGPDVEFEFVWIGPYQYRDHLLDTFRVGRTIFIGDAAHVVCPFGARGGNNGIQDAANLGWKLALVLAGQAGDGADRQLSRRAPRGGGREPARHQPDGALPRAAQRRRASPAARRRRARAPARVRAPDRQHRPDGAGQRLSAVAVGAGGRDVAAERRRRRNDA